MNGCVARGYLQSKSQRNVEINGRFVFSPSRCGTKSYTLAFEIAIILNEGKGLSSQSGVVSSNLNCMRGGTNVFWIPLGR